MRVRELIKELSRWNGEDLVVLTVGDQPFQMYGVVRTESTTIEVDEGGADSYEECEVCGCEMPAHRHLVHEPSFVLVGDRLKNAFCR